MTDFKVIFKILLNSYPRQGLKIMNKWAILIVLALNGFLLGCSSEVDKCVDAEVKAWAAGKSKYEKADNFSKSVWDIQEDKVQLSLDKSKEEISSEARFRCLRAASKIQ